MDRLRLLLSPSLAFQWRFELSAQVIASAILLMGTPWLPESPRWLVEQDHQSEALEILQKLHPLPNESNIHSKAQVELNQIRAQLSIDQGMEASGGRWALITNTSYRKRLICGCFVQFIGQSTGVLVVNNYQVSLYNSLGLYNSVPLLLYAAYLSWQQVRTTVVAVCCEAAMVAEFSGTSNKIGNGFGIAFLFLFVTFYGAYVYSAEVFPNHMRGLGIGLSIFPQFCSTLVYTQVASTAFDTVGWKYYLVFIIIPFVGAILIGFTLPEPKGLSLEDISCRFEGRPVTSEMKTDMEDTDKASVCYEESV
ncbi:uncharacterized protein N7483_005792 [Penicillium malachiteum]|uniref:uncharacterized protein n=1 Tax=Penicillium malachiteum TaxID=1324776 RepID=UPI002548D4EA|nr:uncharacterized protein N7483_005792 [Penicillium malachiteum]KAJ5731284.1 hypothetical protein N7483_005792 [Penicillium malachiteum]